ncbi:hypothetical protein F4820DRAFT_465742 [Hypoxylon rubiginosum]|uniref:Uncharacterized protein n=1 Tax=Hypoxylon rubiginosum TaxID=110542 RepID=A0ACB9YLX7_9PEZI|nr:hypothetical protein F4820DRAFT_465742 [Hypoxylon rubiginosum]
MYSLKYTGGRQLDPNCRPKSQQTPTDAGSCQWLKGRREQDRMSIVGGGVALERRREQDRNEALSRCSVDGEEQVHPSVVEKGARRRGAKARPRLSVVQGLELWREQDHNEHCRRLGARRTARTRGRNRAVVDGILAGEDKTGQELPDARRAAENGAATRHWRDGCSTVRRGQDRSRDLVENMYKLEGRREPGPGRDIVETTRSSSNTQNQPFAEPESLSRGYYAQEISSDTASRLPTRGFLGVGSPPFTRRFLRIPRAEKVFRSGDLPANPSQTSGQLPLERFRSHTGAGSKLDAAKKRLMSYSTAVGGQTLRCLHPSSARAE